MKHAILLSKSPVRNKENRLSATRDQYYATANIYDASGNRAWKLGGEVNWMWNNGQGYQAYGDLNLRTWYQSDLVTITDQAMTKHYFIAGQRIASKLVEHVIEEAKVSMKQDHLQPINEESKDLGSIASQRLQRDFDCLGIDYNAFYPGNKQIESLEALQSAPEVNEYQVFFYHSDHLGSSSFITDANGDATQHLQYLPFGEDLVHEQNTAAYLSPYTFSGKERDVETSLSYFGARYYDASLSIWLSVDPLSEARPYLSPYNYCQLNPVMLVDPTGMLDDQPGDLVGEATSKDGGSVNFFNRLLSQMPTPAPEGLPATMRPSSAEYDQNPMIAGSGGDDPPKKKGTSVERQLIYGLPIIGPTQESSDKLVSGDYWGAFGSFGWAVLDVLLVGQASSASNWVLKNLPSSIRNSKVTIHFGQNAAQTRHAFRHMTELGLDPKIVQAAVEAHFRPISSQVVAGAPFDRVIVVNGQKIQYTAWRLAENTFNIGRIHGVK